MSPVYYSEKTHRKIVHFSQCKVLKKIPEERLLCFQDLKQAKEHGYRLCKCCPSLAREYRKDQAEIDSYCRKAGFMFKLQDDVIHIISKHDCWRLIFDAQHNKMKLFHKNTQQRYFKKKKPVIINGFHVQPCHYKSVLEYLKYISSHDQYRDTYTYTEKKSYIQESEYEPPEWVLEKYGEEYLSSLGTGYERIKGTKKYKKEQKKRKRKKHRASIRRVYELIEELAVIGG